MPLSSTAAPSVFGLLAAAALAVPALPGLAAAPAVRPAPRAPVAATATTMRPASTTPGVPTVRATRPTRRRTPESSTPPGSPAVGSGAWTWPSAPTPTVRRPFDAPAERWAPGHRGVDLAVTAPTVLAPYDGVVAFAGVVAGRPVLSIDHPGGLRTTYEPVRALVPAGTRVRTGHAVGRLAGPSHCGGAACLHWGLRRGRDYLDPLALLSRGAPVLLPLD